MPKRKYEKKMKTQAQASMKFVKKGVKILQFPGHHNVYKTFSIIPDIIEKKKKKEKGVMKVSWFSCSLGKKLLKMAAE